MSDDDDLLQLTVMLRALASVAEYIEGLDEEAFIGRRLIIDGVAMNLLVVGEAASKLSPGLKAQVPARWREVISLRHRLAHDYFGMRTDRLWATARESAPELEQLVRTWLEAR